MTTPPRTPPADPTTNAATRRQRPGPRARIRRAAVLACLLAASAHAATPVLKGQTERPLRYRPEGGGFVIDDGPDAFNRPLYGGHTAFRVDAGDRPEFSLYLPGRGGVVRVGLLAGGRTKWLRDAAHVRATYVDASMNYVVTDPLWPGVTVTLTAVALRDEEGLALKAQVDGADEPAEVIFAYGGVTGERAKRDGDIGTEAVPVSQYFALRPEHCRDDAIAATADGFTLKTRAAGLVGVATGETTTTVADAANWADPAKLTAADSQTPLAVVRSKVRAGRANLFLLRRATQAATTQPASIDDAFGRSIAQHRDVARQVTVDTPDAFVNSAVPALCVAADALWDAASGTYMHGGVAWRRPYLGWRGPYCGDATGDHVRTRSHLDAYFAKQNTSPPVATQPADDESDRLARSERQIKTDGDLTASHYDMNLVAIDAFFRHLLWTGDLDYARRQWPVIEKHLAWERRLFRRPFGPDGLPLYEAYACIWASDDLQYSGGGVTHASAYNYYHNLMAARVVALLAADDEKNGLPRRGNAPATSVGGKQESGALPRREVHDSAFYQHEADLIKRAMQQYLWMPDRGAFAEYKDWLGDQLVHPSIGLWTHYHTIDSLVPDAQDAWRMCRYVDATVPRLPVHGPGVPAGLSLLSSTNWTPYTWSINNVATAEVTHTALADWQAGRADAAFALWKGAVVDGMFRGQCPGNLPMTLFFDAYRQEAQRDSGDPVGATWRATIEGLFGITPDALAGELRVRPGYPAVWRHAAITHPDVAYAFKRDGDRDTYAIESKFKRPMTLRLSLPARRDRVAGVTVNGRPATWRNAGDAVGGPRVEIVAVPADKWDVAIAWAGDPIRGAAVPSSPGGEPASNDSGREIVPRITFVRTTQGEMTWWQPIEHPEPATSVAVAARSAAGVSEPVDLSGVFNDSVTRVFKNRYASPRSPFASLSMPVQGFGGWATNKTTPVIDDSGLRAAGGVTLPDGTRFVTPREGKNVLFVSQWDNYPRAATVPLSGKANRVELLMAGTTNAMQSRLDNGEVVVAYADGTTARLALRNPQTWWPIEQDYFVDDYAFDIGDVYPMRVDLKTGRVRQPTRETLGKTKGFIDGGAATVLSLPLDGTKELKSLTVRAVANEVVIGVMGVALER